MTIKVNNVVNLTNNVIEVYYKDGSDILEINGNKKDFIINKRLPWCSAQKWQDEHYIKIVSKNNKQAEDYWFIYWDDWKDVIKINSNTNDFNDAIVSKYKYENPDDLIDLLFTGDTIVIKNISSKINLKIKNVESKNYLSTTNDNLLLNGTNHRDMNKNHFQLIYDKKQTDITGKSWYHGYNNIYGDHYYHVATFNQITHTIIVVLKKQNKNFTFEDYISHFEAHKSNIPKKLNIAKELEISPNDAIPDYSINIHTSDGISSTHLNFNVETFVGTLIASVGMFLGSCYSLYSAYSVYAGLVVAAETIAEETGVQLVVEMSAGAIVGFFGSLLILVGIVLVFSLQKNIIIDYSFNNLSKNILIMLDSYFYNVEEQTEKNKILKPLTIVEVEDKKIPTYDCLSIAVTNDSSYKGIGCAFIFTDNKDSKFLNLNLRIDYNGNHNVDVRITENTNAEYCYNNYTDNNTNELKWSDMTIKINRNKEENKVIKGDINIE